MAPGSARPVWRPLRWLTLLVHTVLTQAQCHWTVPPGFPASYRTPDGLPLIDHGTACLDIARAGPDDPEHGCDHNEDMQGVCCECGGGSRDPVASCRTPVGKSWDEEPVDCGAVGRVRQPPVKWLGQCAGATCTVDDCCRDADWAPRCNGAVSKLMLLGVTGKLADPPDGAADCIECIQSIFQDMVDGVDGNLRDPMWRGTYCFPEVTRTACSSTEVSLYGDIPGLGPDQGITLPADSTISESCAGCIVAASYKAYPAKWPELCSGLTIPTSCSGLSEFMDATRTVSDACCTDGIVCDSNGIPSICTSECAEVLVPYHQLCADMLTANGLSASVDAAFHSCGSTPPAAPTSCDGFSGFMDFVHAIATACCTDGIDCDSNGIPSSCTEDCATVMIPFQHLCADMLTANGLSAMADAAVSSCPQGSR